MENPFVISLIAQRDRFADREAEVARIEAALRAPGGKLIVYGDRRQGKSSAIEAAAAAVIVQEQAELYRSIAARDYTTDPLAGVAERV